MSLKFKDICTDKIKNAIAEIDNNFVKNNYNDMFNYVFSNDFIFEKYDSVNGGDFTLFTKKCESFIFDLVYYPDDNELYARIVNDDDGIITTDTEDNLITFLEKSRIILSEYNQETQNTTMHYILKAIQEISQ